MAKRLNLVHVKKNIPLMDMYPNFCYTIILTVFKLELVQYLFKK